MKAKQSRKSRLRLAVQLFFFLLIGTIAVNKVAVEGGWGLTFFSEASLHALCPFGGVVTLYNLFTLGTFIQKIHASAVILMGLVFGLAVLFGPVFCGWVCPLGSIQEWIGGIGKNIFKSKYNRFVPEQLDKVLRYGRYVILVLVVFVTARSGYLMFENIDPYNALFTFWSEEVALPALVILIVTLVGSLFIERPWCKYACPYGGLLGLFNKFRLFKIRRNSATCISCSKCDQVCPMNIIVSKTTVVNNTSCITCLACTSERSCPVEDTVALQIRRYDMNQVVSEKGGENNEN